MFYSFIRRIGKPCMLRKFFKQLLTLVLTLLPRRVRFEPELSSVSSQLGHSQPQRPTMGEVEGRSMAPSKWGPSTRPRRPDKMAPTVEADAPDSCCSEEVASDPTLLLIGCSGLCNGFSRSAIDSFIYFINAKQTFKIRRCYDQHNYFIKDATAELRIHL